MTDETDDGRKQILIQNANKAQLRAFAEDYGLTIHNFDNADVIITKLREAGWDHPFVLEVTEKKAEAKKAGGAISEPMVKIYIHKGTGRGGERPVFVAVNGKGILIPRGSIESVKLRYFNALDVAVETQYFTDPVTNELDARDIHSYPFQVHEFPMKEDIERWYAYERAMEAKHNADRASRRRAA